MAEEATRRITRAAATQVVPWVAIGLAALGVFATWASDGPVRLDGVEGPNNGWLVLIVAALALGWAGAMARGSWVGVLGVLGASVVMGWTAIANWLDNRDVYGSTASWGLVLVVAASVALAASAVVRGVELSRNSKER